MFLFKYIQNYKNNIALISEETGAITYNQLTQCINKKKKNTRKIFNFFNF